MAIRGPEPALAAEKTAVPTVGVGGTTVAATRVPQRAQNTSTPGVTGVPHDPHTARDIAGCGAVFATRPPHLAQKGSDGSTAVPQVGQGALPGGIPASGDGTGRGAGGMGGTAGAPGAGGGAAGGPAEADTRVGGTPNRPPIVSPSAELTDPLWATGLPQSMQNFDAGSFSRPQTAQRMVKAYGAGESGEYRAQDHGAGAGTGKVRRAHGRGRLRPVPRLRSLLLSLLLLGVAATRAAAQVRPDLAWRTLETAHFRIHFTPELEALARRTAANAETAWAQLSDELVPPRGTVDIVVADNVDYANGYATPYPSNRIVIYARPPVEELGLRNHREWNALLVTHELAHIFHLDRVRGPWAVAQRVFGRAAPLFPNTYAPSWLLEGLAVHFETRITGAGRLAGTEFPALVRARAITGDLPALHELSLAAPRFPGGTSAYLYGSYAVTRSEPAAMRRFVERQSGRLNPWRHDATARDAFGESFTVHWAAWRDSVLRADASRAEAVRADAALVDAARADAAATTTITAHGWTARFPRWLDDDRLLYVANDARSTTGVYRLALDGRRTRLGRRNSVDVSAPAGDVGTLQGELDFRDPWTLHSDLYRGLGLGRRRETRGERLSAPDVHEASGTVVAVRTDPGTTSLVTMALRDGMPRELVAGTLDRTWAEPRWSRDGARIAAVRWERGGRSAIVVLDRAGVERQRFAPRGPRLTVVSAPAWEPGDTTLLFVSDHEGRPMVYRGDLRTGAYGRVWSTATALNTPDVARDGARIAAVELRADGYHVVTRATPRDVPLARPAADTTPDPLALPPAAEDREVLARRYSAWDTVEPRWWLPVLAQTGPGTTAFGAMTGGHDVLQRHTWYAQATLEPSRNEMEGYLTYHWAGLGQPLVSASYDQEWSHGAIRDGGGAFVGWLGARERTARVDLVVQRPRVRLSSFAVLGAEASQLDFRSYPRELLPQIDGGVFTTYVRTQALRVAAGFSTLQRPMNAVSPEDGITASISHRLRYGIGLRLEDVGETIVATTAAKSLPLPGYARHVVAVRGAYGVTGHRTTAAFSVGGVNGSSLELVPGVVIGGSARDFGVRGFTGGAQLGVRAAAVSAEYRAPLGLVGRGVAMLPVFLQKASVTAFADAGSAWCSYEVADSFICPAVRTERTWLASVGGELGLDGSLQYDRAYRFRFGLAHPVRGEAFAPRATSVYFSLGSSF